MDAGASAVREILSSPETPTVIFCGSDLIALGAITAWKRPGGGFLKMCLYDISFACLARPTSQQSSGRGADRASVTGFGIRRSCGQQRFFRGQGAEPAGGDCGLWRSHRVPERDSWHEAKKASTSTDVRRGGQAHRAQLRPETAMVPRRMPLITHSARNRLSWAAVCP